MPGPSKNRNDKRWLNTLLEGSISALTGNRNNGLRVVCKLNLVTLYRFTTTSAKHERPEPIGDLAPALWHQVPVYVHRDVDRRVPHECLARGVLYWATHPAGTGGHKKTASLTGAVTASWAFPSAVVEA